MDKNERLYVLSVFGDLVKICDEIKCIHDSIMVLPEGEKEKHDVWFKAKIIASNDFMSKVQLWVSTVDQGVLVDGAVANLGGIHPDDSVSNVASKNVGKSFVSGR